MHEMFNQNRMSFFNLQPQASGLAWADTGINMSCIVIIIYVYATHDMFESQSHKTAYYRLQQQCSIRS